MRRALVAVVVTVGLAACGGGRPGPGVITGRAFAPCFGLRGGHVSVTVDVYTTLYAGKWGAALSRVQLLGVDSGEPVVAKRVMANGDVYRISVPYGRYIVAVGQGGHLVTVSSSHVTVVNFPQECI